MENSGHSQQGSSNKPLEARGISVSIAGGDSSDEEVPPDQNESSKELPANDHTMQVTQETSEGSSETVMQSRSSASITSETVRQYRISDSTGGGRQIIQGPSEKMFAATNKYHTSRVSGRVSRSVDVILAPVVPIASRTLTGKLCQNCLTTSTCGEAKCNKVMMEPLFIDLQCQSIIDQ